VIHESQGLAFGLEASNDASAVHAGLDDLQGDAPADWLFLLGEEDRTHAALADELQ
jgi:hypothetical protein